MILHIAKREWLEQRRHPGMLAICGVLLVVLAVLNVLALGLLQAVQATPDNLEVLESLLGSPEAAAAFVDNAANAVLAAWNFLLFSQYLGFVGVIGGHSLLHDRQVSTLPFLLLAPVGRLTLLAGKTLGALGPLTLLLWTICVVGGASTLLFPIAAPWPQYGPRSLSWWVALMVAGPSWACFVAGASATVSSVARDVRLAQQGVWFVVFFVQLLVAFLITGSLGSLGSQVLAAGLGGLASALALGAGTAILQRDLGR